VRRSRGPGRRLTALAPRSPRRRRLSVRLFTDFGFLSSNNPGDGVLLELQQQRFSAEKFFTSDPNDPPFSED
jgi:hypothetical protein